MCINLQFYWLFASRARNIARQLGSSVVFEPGACSVCAEFIEQQIIMMDIELKSPSYLLYLFDEKREIAEWAKRLGMECCVLQYE